MDLLDKTYLTIKDLQEITGIGYKAAGDIIKQAIDLAIAKNYLLPNTNKLIAPTSIVRELLKI